MCLPRCDGPRVEFGRQFCDAEDSKGDFVDWAHADVLKVQASLHPLFRSTWKQGYEAFFRKATGALARKQFAEAARPSSRATGPPLTSCLSWRDSTTSRRPGWDGRTRPHGFGDDAIPPFVPPSL